jgi:hypothetical protein
VAKRVYVPGYGYVTQGEKGTGVTSRPGGAPSQPRPTSSSPSLRGQSVPGSTPGTPTPAGGPRITYRPPTGVAYPLSGTGGFGGQRGYAFGQRQGYNPDRLERFPYGVQFRTQETATGEFSKLDPGYQAHLNALAKNPAHGTRASTGRALWERINKLAAESTALGRPQTPQEIAAEIAYNLGVSPLEGRDGSDPFGGSGSRSYGGGGYGGGGSASQSRIDLSSPSDAQAILTQFMQSAVGRNPKPGEVRKFYELLQGYQQNNPTVVTAAGDTVTQSGGIDPGAVAQQFVQELPDYSEQQADRYYRTFMSSLLGGSV